MWASLAKHYNGDEKISLKDSFYCGDAAGRKSDFSDTDKLFANSVGLKFLLPEEYFLD